ncbi:MAG: phosphatidate cytidylyltransferase [Bdellovibrionia bacterium]
MKQGSPELQRRVLTGVIGGFALLGLLIFGGWVGVFVFTMALSMGMIYEFSEIVFTMPDKIEKRYVLFLMIWFIGLINLIARHVEFPLLIVSFLVLFTYYLLTARRHSEALFSLHIRELMYSLFGLVYLCFIPLYFSRIYESAHGVEWVVLFLLIVFAGDTGAYFAGMKYGKHKLYPAISPKKTVEGAIGGIVSGVFITLFAKLVFFKSLHWSGILFFPIFVGPVAQIGDLCESFLKRSFDRKDSGSILPGHGGFLDRFDGVVFSLPVMYACIQLLG